MDLARDQYLRQKTNKGFTFPFFFCCRRSECKTCALELVGRRGLVALRPSRKVSTIAHMITNLQPTVSYHTKVAKNKSKISCYKTTLSPKNNCLGFSEKTASEGHQKRNVLLDLRKNRPGSTKDVAINGFRELQAAHMSREQRCYFGSPHDDTFHKELLAKAHSG